MMLKSRNVNKSNINKIKQKIQSGTFLVVEWLRFWAPTARGTGLILGQGTKIPKALWCYSEKKEEEEKETNQNICIIKYKNIKNSLGKNYAIYS